MYYDFSGKVVGYHKLMIYIFALGLPGELTTHEGAFLCTAEWMPQLLQELHDEFKDANS